MAEGWISLHRKLLDNPLWTCETFTRGQAWVDLLLLANHTYNYFYKRGVKIEVSRGQCAYSSVALADRWKWSRSKVKKFLNDLEKEQQIVQQNSNVTQTITILKYEEYQKNEQQTVQQKSSKRAAKEQQKDTNNNVNKENNVNNENKNYREFAHLKITNDENDKLLKIYSQSEVDDILNSIENFKSNTKYNSLYLTALKWLKKEHPNKQQTTTTGKKKLAV